LMSSVVSIAYSFASKAVVITGCPEWRMIGRLP